MGRGGVYGGFEVGVAKMVGKAVQGALRTADEVGVGVGVGARCDRAAVHNCVCVCGGGGRGAGSGGRGNAAAAVLQAAQSPHAGGNRQLICRLAQGERRREEESGGGRNTGQDSSPAGQAPTSPLLLHRLAPAPAPRAAAVAWPPRTAPWGRTRTPAAGATPAGGQAGRRGACVGVGVCGVSGCGCQVGCGGQVGRAEGVRAALGEGRKAACAVGVLGGCGVRGCVWDGHTPHGHLHVPDPRPHAPSPQRCAGSNPGSTSPLTASPPPPLPLGME